MAQVYKGILPKNSLLNHFPGHYTDSYVGEFISEKDVAIEDTVKVFFTASPPWVQHLFSHRNRLVKLFGLKASEADAGEVKSFEVKVGQSLGLFKIIEKNPSEVIMGEDDKHLDFRVSILMHKEGNHHQLTISTKACFHNLFGKMYFFFIKPFHKLIVKNMLLRIVRVIPQAPEIPYSR